MAREEILPALGLYTDVNPSTSPRGANSVVTDVVIDRPNLIEPRPGFDKQATTVSTASRASALAPFLSHLFSLNANATCEDLSAAAAISGLLVPPRVSDREYATAQLRNSLYATTSNGPYKLDTTAGPWARAGLGRSLGAVITPAAYDGALGGGFLSLYEAVAYRFVLKRTDANNYIRRSQPSERCVFYAGYNTNARQVVSIVGVGPYVLNLDAAPTGFLAVGNTVAFTDGFSAVSATTATISATGATSITVNAVPTDITLRWVQPISSGANSLLTGGWYAGNLAIDLQDDAIVGDTLEIYRSVAVDGRVAIPSDQMYLVAAHRLTTAEIAAKVYNFQDLTDDTALTSGAELYTNSTQLGILQSKLRPPWCSDIESYNQMLFFADTKTPWRLLLDGFNQSAASTPHQTPNVETLQGATGAIGGTGNAMAVSGGTLNPTAGNPVVPSGSDLRPYVGCIIVEGTTQYPGVSVKLAPFSKIIAATATTITVDKNPIGSGAVASTTLWPTFTVDGGNYYGTDRYNPTTFEFQLANVFNSLLALGPTVAADYGWSQLAHLINVNSARVSAWATDGGFSAQDAQWGTQAKPKLTLEWRVFDTDTAPTFTYGLVRQTALQGALTSPQLDATSLTATTSTGLVPTPFLRDAFEGCLFASAVNEPEAVPPTNFVLIGDSGKRIRRIIATTTALWAFKDDGLYRISGFDPSQLRVDLVDPTIRILRSETADAGGQAIFVWTTQGPGILSDAGFQPISKPIRNLLLPIEQAFASYPTGIHGMQVTYDRVERRVYFCTPSTSGGKDAAIAYVWSENTQAWTKWNLSTSAMCWDPATGKIRWSYVASGARVLLTTRDRATLGFASHAYTGDYPTAITVSSVTPGTSSAALVLSAPAVGISVNDAIVDNDGNAFRVSAVADTTHVTVATAGTDPVAGAAIWYTRQSGTVGWQLKPQPTPFIQKVYRDTRAIFHDLLALGGYTMTYRSFTSQASPITATAAVSVPTTVTATDYLRRCGVPRNVARASNFDVEMSFEIACGMFSIGGMAVTWEEGSEMLSR